MQSYLQKRRIYKQLQRQIVVKRESPNDVWTHERRYWYLESGGIQSEERDPDDGVPAARRREHGQRTMIAGPALEPRHSLRAHLGREEDIERQDCHAELDVEPFTINTRDTLGADTDMMVTGVEGQGRRNEVRATGQSVSSTESSDYGDEKEKIVIVTYEGDCDPEDPHNWSFSGRCAATLLVTLLGAVVLWSSTIDATALTSTSKLFHTSFAVETIPTCLYLGFLGIGALITAPLSEVFGRNPIYLTCMPCFILFNMGAGLAQNVIQRSICRGFAGAFGSAPLVCSAAALVDLWSLIERNYAFPFFAIVAFEGAVVGPVPGAIITWSTSVTWRWVDWLTDIMAGFLLVLVFLFLPETYSPIILHWKAKKLRRLTNDDRYRSPLQFRLERTSFLKRIGRALSRPFILFWTEPIIIIFSAWLAVIFIILYTFSAGFDAIFMKIYHLDQGQVGVTFLSLAIGVLLAAPFVPLTQYLVRRDIYRARAKGQSRPQPEFNLYMSMFGAPFIPISLFWMGWSSRPSVSMWCPLVAAMVFGFGVVCVFISSYQYVAAAFENHPASALATVQVFRLVAAGVMACIAEYMYHGLGVAWTMTLLGCLAFVFMPVPYVLYWYGQHVRRWSRHSPT